MTFPGIEHESGPDHHARRLAAMMARHYHERVELERRHTHELWGLAVTFRDPDGARMWCAQHDQLVVLQDEYLHTLLEQRQRDAVASDQPADHH